ncbi:MAG TPA: hypothetical protein VL832_08475 [Puia sp.]|nr:hypothetical protein [Puia sp.]
MKLPQLLSQYLYQTKKLELPGIGRFILDPAAVIPEESDKSGQAVATGITFSNSLVTTPEDGLITFIKEHTGKMKPLAAADLDFFLTTGKQLLNIGKPFYLEGIGTLMQNKDGRLDFTPGEYSTARLQDPAMERKEKRPATTYDEPPPREYEPKSNTIRQALLLIGLIGGLVAIGWGGYYLYKRNTFVEPTVEPKPAAEAKAMTPDSNRTADSSQSAGGQAGAGSAGAGQPGAAGQSGAGQPAGGATSTKPADTPAPGVTPSTAATSVPTVVPPGASLYKFVILETTKKGKALRRYNQLLGYQLNIKMDQKDSSYFKLYFPIAATIRDTTHIRDSLMDVYAAHVTIEH